MAEPQPQPSAARPPAHAARGLLTTALADLEAIKHVSPWPADELETIFGPLEGRLREALAALSLERTGWRDAGLSARHRSWGFDLPATDLDFLLLEYTFGKAKAIVEYKHERATSTLRICHPTIEAIRDLADKAELPFFVVRYSDDYLTWTPHAGNAHARVWVPGGVATLRELEYVQLLKDIRRYAPAPPPF
jgi:hypothetical protein